MDDIVRRFMEDYVGRVTGPMKFRLLLQPLMAIIFAVRDGRRDARKGAPFYGYALFTNPSLRRDLFRDGWKSVGKIFILAVVLDVIYQYIVLKWFYPAEAMTVAAALALLPYLLLRGPVNRLFSRKRTK